MTKIRFAATLISATLLLMLAMPSFSAELVTAKQYGESWPFPAEKNGALYCKTLGGGRKAVWLNADSTYALNGQAMSWMIGAGIDGADGNPVKKGRDFSNNPEGLHQLIQDGLALCK